MKVNIGCGPHYQPGWVNTDGHPDAEPDILTTGFPFEDGTAERVYLGHVLEHQRWDAVPAFLSQVRRILAPDGQVLAAGPDVNRVIQRHAQGIEPWWLVNDVLEHADRETSAWPGSGHHWNCHEERLEQALRDAGFATKALPPEELHPGWEGWPLTNWSMWQCAVLAW